MLNKILIVVFILCIGTLVIGLTVTGDFDRLFAGVGKEKRECMKYRDFPLDGIPAKCVKYFR